MFLRSSLARCARRLPLSLPVYSTVEHGKPGTREWRLRYVSEESIHDPDNTSGEKEMVSVWHHLPSRPLSKPLPDPGEEERIFTFVTEIPKGTRAKMELCKEEALNPIKQDVLKKEEGQPVRYFKYGDAPFNYGFIPQTWENPLHVDARTRCGGDGDPIDVASVAPYVAPIGSYEAVRVLGVVGLVDQGETDWKVIVEPVFPQHGMPEGGYKKLENVPQEMREAMLDWFENYKVAEGKGKNEFAGGKEFKDVDFALGVIADCMEQYSGLMEGRIKNPGYWLY